MSHKRRRGRGQGSLFKRQGEGSWIATWYDHEGKRRERSTRTTDKAAAERILAKHLASSALRRDGVIDSRQDRFTEEGQRPFHEHTDAYITHCRRAGQSPRAVSQKQRHLELLGEHGRLTRLSELSADALEHHLSLLQDAGKSARTINFVRQNVVAFYNWCVKTGRAERNPLSVVPKLDEQRDRRRVRRALSDAELARLLLVAKDRGREAWYLAAVFAGLRKGDLQRLTWGDVNFDHGTITIQAGKSRRVDTLSMHPQLADALKRKLEAQPALGGTKVFPKTVTDRTRDRDFQRAGISKTDTDGRVADLHALRTTLATQLARAGTAPQIAQRIMRHSDYRTTLSHYTVLGLTDTAQAIEALPNIGQSADRAAHATGTDGRSMADTAESHPQLIPQQLGCDTLRNSALRGVGSSHADDSETAPKTNEKRPLRTVKRQSG